MKEMLQIDSYEWVGSKEIIGIKLSNDNILAVNHERDKEVRKITTYCLYLFFRNYPKKEKSFTSKEDMEKYIVENRHIFESVNIPLDYVLDYLTKEV